MCRRVLRCAVDGQNTSLMTPWPIVAHSRAGPSEVVTKSLSLLDHVGGIPGAPKACSGM
jgi:hypothetical protein